jgi:hypothetical protein
MSPVAGTELSDESDIPIESVELPHALRNNVPISERVINVFFIKGSPIGLIS